MNINNARKNFVEKARKYFDFLVNDYGYIFKGHTKSDWTDKLHFENFENDRLIILSNQYHPVDYGFEIQLFKPSDSTEWSEREICIYKLKEDQDEEQTYLIELAEDFKTVFEQVLIGAQWISKKEIIETEKYKHPTTNK